MVEFSEKFVPSGSTWNAPNEHILHIRVVADSPSLTLDNHDLRNGTILLRRVRPTVTSALEVAGAPTPA